MKSSIVKLGVALPLVAAGMLGLSGTAQAATFNDGDQININGSLQLQNFFPNLPGSVIDVLFVPDLPAGGVAPLGETALGNIDSTGNTGAFSIFNDPSPITSDAQAEVRSFNVLSGDVGGFSASDFFVLADSSFAYPNGGSFPTKFAFSLDVNSIAANFNLLATGYAIDFTAAGQVLDLGADGLFGTADDGETSDVVYDFTAQGLTPNAAGTTNVSTYSGSIIVEAEVVPEPGATTGLLALGGVFGIGGFLKRKQGKKINVAG